MMLLSNHETKRGPFNQRVLGSIPSGLTTTFRRFLVRSASAKPRRGNPACTAAFIFREIREHRMFNLAQAVVWGAILIGASLSAQAQTSSPEPAKAGAAAQTASPNAGTGSKPNPEPESDSHNVQSTDPQGRHCAKDAKTVPAHQAANNAQQCKQ
ncbi:MAG: hypothetical protein IT562_08515 [Alphaproteobacteria bacterium]|nr:hypothetical protein [Alphaproteobacteria bacterium]